jgi:hypothetical protein
MISNTYATGFFEKASKSQKPVVPLCLLAFSAPPLGAEEKPVEEQSRMGKQADE